MSFADDWIAIYQLQANYARYVDEPDLEALVGLFTDDATWSASTPMKVTYRGRQELTAGLTQVILISQNGDPEISHPSVHMLGSPVIQIDGDSAIGHWSLVALALAGAVGEPVLRATGSYEIAYSRVDAGWKIARLDLAIHWTNATGLT
ncbi:nuclear transport factor 2 family protein [Planotetraspora sp. GP83]|uniref:nuclear transport factor 2 family protein n=1 Tax=Planotetraspora sp. GP83 TaxID=3156264 RepID=UPI0035113351